MDQRNVGDRAGHHVADTVTVEKFGALILQTGVQPLAQVESNIEPRSAHTVAGKGHHNVSQADRADDAEDQPCEIVVACRHAVDDDPRQKRHHRFKEPCNAESADTGKKSPPVGMDEMPQAPERIEH